MKNSTIKNEIANYIIFLENKITNLKKKLNQNFLSEFAFVCEELFTYEFQLQQLIYKFNFLCDNTIDGSEQKRIGIIIEEFEQFLNHAGNIRNNSNNSLHREVSTWKYAAILELKNYFNNFVESETEVETEDVERNEHGDEFVSSCNKCGRDINSAESNRHGNCKNKCQ
jgi:hypothetical protein